MGGIATPGVDARLDAAFSASSVRVNAGAALQLRGPFKRGRLPVYYLRNVTAGVFAGDHYRAGITAEAGTAVRVGSTSATKVHEMPSGCAVSETTLIAGADSTLVYGPHATLLQSGSDYRQSLSVSLQPGAVIALAEVLVMGRIARGESCHFRRFQSDLVVTDSNRTIYEERYVLEPSPALTTSLGGHAVVVSVYVFGVQPGDARQKLAPVIDAAAGVRAGSSALPYDAGVIVRALAPSLSAGALLAEHCLDVVDLA